MNINDQYRPDYLFDMLVEKQNLKNDRELADALEVSPSVISLARTQVRPRITAELLVRIHDVFGYPIETLRQWAGMEAYVSKTFLNIKGKNEH